MNCTDCRELLLDHLYGALDDAEERALRAHVRDCGACTAALERARGDRELLAEAARMEAGDVRLAGPASGRRRLRPLAAAAAVLVACGLGALGYRSVRRAEIVERHPRLLVQGPALVRGGTPAEFLVALTDLDGDPLPATVTARISGPDHRVFHEEELRLGPDGTSRLRYVPPEGQAGERLRLDVAARLPDGGQEQASTLLVREGTALVGRVSTDKPLYRPGEPVRARAVLLERFRLTPAGAVPVMFRVRDPRGSVVAEGAEHCAEGGVAAFQWDVPAGTAGGEYRLELEGVDDATAFPKVERSFVVQSYRVPRLRADVELDRDSYAPGGKGEAWVSVERAEGGVPAGATLDAVLSVDGEEVSRETLEVPASGRLTVPFTLPAEVAEPRAQLALVVRDGGAVETFAETVLVALGRLDVELFPEGGDLVAGLPARVYFRVRDPGGEPADLTAELRDARDRVVATAQVETLGLGAFEFTPRAGETYRLVARSPADVELRGELPTVVEHGVALRAVDETTRPGQPIRVRVAATRAGEYVLSAHCRGTQVAQGSVTLDAFESRELALARTADAGGVARVTVFDAAGVPRAERLVALDPARRIELEVRPLAEAVSPGDPVKVEITARDEQGRPVQAVLGASVVDETVLQLAQDDDTPALPLHFLLGLEVEELEDVQVYAGGPEAVRAVDRLLGTQGWRRFAWRSPSEFLAAHAEKGPRVVTVASAAEVPVRADSLGAAREAVRWEMRRVDRGLRTGAVALGVVGLLLAGVVLAWRHPLGRKFVLPAMSAAVLGGVLVLLVPRMGARLADAGAEMEFLALEEKELPAMAAAPAPGAPAPERPLPEVAVVGLDLDGDGRLHRFGGGGGAGAGHGLLAKLVAEVGEVVQAELPPVLEPRGGLDGPAARPQMDFEFADERSLGSLVWHVRAREYSHTRPARAPDAPRDDFTEVLCWRPLLLTDADGRATLEFQTSDSLTTFLVSVEAHDARGALAADAGRFRNRLPFSLEPKLPVELSTGDRLSLPVVVANDTDAALDVGVELTASAEFVEVRGAPRRVEHVRPGQRGRATFDLVARDALGVAEVTLEGRTMGGHADRVTRRIPVVPRGYPFDVARGGTLERQDDATFRLPDDLDPRTLEGALKLYPSVLSTLLEGLDAMLQEPYGCFEQASSTNYPNVLVLTYLSEQDQAAPDVARRARELLARGYERLTGYECRQRGFEWFGGDPAHEALSAYGLMEFVDMARVHEVDAEMIGRTREWLLGRRDGKGGFERNERALDSFGGAPREITDAYVVWALTEADPTVDLARELALLEERARTSDDPYLVALCVNSLANRRSPAAKELGARLVRMQQPDGRLAGRTTSITSSSGINLDVETTALAVLAFVRDPATLPNAEAAVAWMLENRQGGRFGATQATILALRALVAHSRAARRTSTDHTLTVLVNGVEVATRTVAAGTPGSVVFGDEVLRALRAGENRVEIRTTGAEALPWSLALRCRTKLPPSDPDCAVGVTTALARTELDEGDTVRLDVTLTNRRSEGVPMVLARIGLPAGLEPRADQLKELRERGEVAFYETRPREVTLYLRGMAPSEARRVALDLVAAVPGRFEGPATSAYLYYTDDAKDWAAPLEVTVR